jgi:hypothetical protein
MILVSTHSFSERSTMETLVCQRCNAEKPLEQFSRYKTAGARRRPFCKACHATEERWYRTQRREILGANHPLLASAPRLPRPKIAEPPERTCSRCHVTKPLAAFAWSTKHHRLHKRVCTTCTATQQRVHRDRRRIEATKPRRCVDCNTVKPAEEFHWRIKSQFLLQARCKHCALQTNALYKQEQKTLLGEAGMAAYHKEQYHKSRESQLAYHKDYYQKNKETQKVKSKAWYTHNRDRVRVQSRLYRLKSRFGITLDDYNAMLLAQNNACAICGQHGRKLHVDHCHTTGKVRGLLCAPCNSFLGRIKESLDILDNVKCYLLQYPQAIPSTA